MNYVLYLLIAVLIVILIIGYIFLNRKINLKQRNNIVEKLSDVQKELLYNEEKGKKSNINEWSYQRFSNFFNATQLKDENFDKKIELIYSLIMHDKNTDLDEIAEKAGCTYNELILKIMYLKNKMKIDPYLYIDRGDHVIRYCSEDDRKLLDKYSKYIYDYHYQPHQIAAKLPETTAGNFDIIEKRVLDDLSYLDDKYLISGLNIDKVDKKIIYYSLEKHKKEKNYISLNCNKCGALNDVPRNGKERCSYCGNIIEDKS